MICCSSFAHQVVLNWTKIIDILIFTVGFPDDSDGKGSACNLGDLDSILRLEDPLEEDMAAHSSILAWRILVDRGAWRAAVHGVAKSQTRLRDTFNTLIITILKLISMTL